MMMTKKYTVVNLKEEMIQMTLQTSRALQGIDPSLLVTLMTTEGTIPMEEAE